MRIRKSIYQVFFGRVESIGLRATKIWIAAKSTVMILPNSIGQNP